MSRWLRLYDDTINDPKILKLPEAMRWHWIAMLCVASKNDGALPILDDIAIQLRVTPAKATEIITVLVKAGLLDKTETGFAPHNWNGRQYKSDVSTERVKRFRNGKRNVSEALPKRPQNTETETEDRIGEARATPSVFTEGSKALASALWKALGFESPLQIPPEYAGVDYRAIEWERAGWTVDLIDAEVRRIGRSKPLSYYEKVFATAFAKRQAPLPVVEISEAQKITVKNHGSSQNSVVAAAKRFGQYFESEPGSCLQGDPDAVLRLPAG
jgi:hypothetical protein